MAGKHDLDAHFGGALHQLVEVIHLEPEKDAIPVRAVGAIADGAVVVLDFKAVQLQDEGAVLDQLFIVRAAMRAAETEQALIPAAAGFDIGDTDEGLAMHGSLDYQTGITKLGLQNGTTKSRLSHPPHFKD